MIDCYFQTECAKYAWGYMIENDQVPMVGDEVLLTAICKDIGHRMPVYAKVLCRQWRLQVTGRNKQVWLSVSIRKHRECEMQPTSELLPGEEEEALEQFLKHHVECRKKVREEQQ